MMRKIFLQCLLLSSLSWGYTLIRHQTNILRKSFSALQGAIQSTIMVPDGIKKQRLDVFLSDSLNDHSRSFYGNLCEKGKIKVNNIIRDKSYKVSKGDSIEYEVEEKEENTNVEPENIPLNILYEDEHIICVNKPNGMVVHPAPGSPNGTFVNALLYHLGDKAIDLLSNPYETTETFEPLEMNDITSIEDLKSDTPFDYGDDDYSDVDFEEDDVDQDMIFKAPATFISSPVDLPETPEAAKASPVYLRPGVVHRLDKGTSGVLLAAKHNNAVAKLSMLFAARKVNKVYLAICVGHPGEATIVEPIGRSQKNRQMMAVYEGPPGKLAISHVRTLAFDGKLSACLVRIETGRTHQIRVHLKHRRTPIVGDDVYGNHEWNTKLARNDNIHRPLLHAYETTFIHPYTNQTITLRAPLPDDMKSIIQKLSIGLPEPLVDESSGYLTCSTEVKGQLASERMKGFVPYDRLAFEEEHWTSFDLPETMDDM